MSPIYQAYNKRNKAWVKYELYGGKSKILNVKERDPKKPFKGVPKRRKK
jgi:hypothetical protein